MLDFLQETLFCNVASLVQRHLLAHIVVSYRTVCNVVIVLERRFLTLAVGKDKIGPCPRVLLWHMHVPKPVVR